MPRIDSATRIVKASPEEVYLAFARPEAMEAWLPPEGMTGRMLAFDFRDGGMYRLVLTYEDKTLAAGKTSADADEVVVRFVALEPGRRIVQAATFESDDPAFAGTMTITWLFDAAAEGTRVSVRCEHVPEGIRAEDHAEGLASTLANLARFVERR